MALERLKNFLSGKKLNPDSPPPHFLALRSSKLFILSTICLAVFTDIFLYGIIVPVIPFALSTRIGVAENKVQSWTSVLLAVYGAALLVISPLAGWYADRSSSRRAPLLFGLFALGGSTVMLCLARTIWLLILGRILQGFSAAIVWTVGQALLVDTVGQKDIGQTLGYVSLSMSLGVLVAPLLGGVVYQKEGYYAVYYMAFALIVLDIVLRLALVEKKIARQWGVDETVDGEETSTTDQTSDRNENIDEEKRPEAAPPEAIRPEPIPTTQRHSKYPPVLTLLSSVRLLVALWGMVVQGALMVAFDSVVPLYVQETFNWNSTGAGLIFLALIIPGFIAPAIGWLSDRYGPRWLCVGGFIFAIPFWVLLRLVTYNSLKQKVLLCALLALIGVGLAAVMPPLMAEVTYVVEAKEKAHPGVYGPNGAYAQAYGLFVTAFAAGTLVGPVWAGYVRDSAGWGTMSWSLGLLSFTAAVPCLIWTGGLITKNNAKTAAERAAGAPTVRSTENDGGDNAV